MPVDSVICERMEGEASPDSSGEFTALDAETNFPYDADTKLRGHANSTNADWIWIKDVERWSFVGVVAPSSISAPVDQDAQTEKANKELPPKNGGKWGRNFRHLVFTAYRRLFTVVLVANLMAMVTLMAKYSLFGKEHIQKVAVAVSVNLFVTTAIRQEYIINIIFRTCWLVPLSAPLWIRRALAKCYEYGGVHSGAAISAILWFALLTANIIRSLAMKELMPRFIIAETILLMVIFLVIIIFAYPGIRVKLHDLFERIHRWAGWAAIVVFWAEIMTVTWEMHGRPQGAEFGKVLVRNPSFWLLIVSTSHSIHPWLRLRRWTFENEKLSSHAIKLTFSQSIHNFSGIAISKSPLKEWHPFATFPRTDGKKGGSLIISNAGDFTNELIHNPRRQYWVKGLPRHGPMSMAQIFRSIVFVTTGSGIGPCLTFLADKSRQQPVRILWSAPNPVETFGEAMCEMVRSIDPNAIIINTRTEGRPNLSQLAYELYIEAKAEAVFVLSNAKLTRKVKYAMEARDIPAYGPIFDS